MGSRAGSSPTGKGKSIVNSQPDKDNSASQSLNQSLEFLVRVSLAEHHFSLLLTVGLSPGNIYKSLFDYQSMNDLLINNEKRVFRRVRCTYLVIS